MSDGNLIMGPPQSSPRKFLFSPFGKDRKARKARGDGREKTLFKSELEASRAPTERNNGRIATRQTALSSSSREKEKRKRSVSVLHLESHKTFKV